MGRPGPASAYDASVHLGRVWAKEITASGYTVHGDLADLVPPDRLESAPYPDEVDPRLQVAPAAEVIADLLLRLHAAQSDLADQASKHRSWKKKTKALRRRLAELDT